MITVVVLSLIAAMIVGVVRFRLLLLHGYRQGCISTITVVVVSLLVAIIVVVTITIITSSNSRSSSILADVLLLLLLGVQTGLSFYDEASGVLLNFTVGF